MMSSAVDMKPKVVAQTTNSAWECQVNSASSGASSTDCSSDKVTPVKNGMIPASPSSESLLKDNVSVDKEKSFDTTRSINLNSDEESCEPSQNSSSSLGLTRMGSSIFASSSYFRHLSEELDETEQEESVYKFERTYSRRGRKSDHQLQMLMNIYIENGGKMTKQML